MLIIDVLNKSAEKTGTIQLPEEIFAVNVSTDTIKQAVHVRLHNARLGTRKTKHRGEVSGGGSKPWRQKGTGRARHGSIRSPIWVGGGHIHALSPGIRTVSIPKKMRRKALLSALTVKFQAGEIAVIENLVIEKPSTKTASEIMSNLAKNTKALILTASKNDMVEKSMRNLPRVTVLEARLLHAYDVLNTDLILIEKDAIDVLASMYITKS